MLYLVIVVEAQFARRHAGMDVTVVTFYRFYFCMLLLLYLFPVAPTDAPRRIVELEGRVSVGIALGPDAKLPNAYFHMCGELFVSI